MLPIKYNHTFDVSRINRDEFLTPFSTLFDDFFNDSFDFLGKDFFEKGTYPKVDVRDEDTKLIIEAEVPGLTKDQVTVELDGDILKIKGEKKSNGEKNVKSYIHKELKHSSFCRSFSIGKNINKGTIGAKFENGILEITLEKYCPEEKKEEVRKILIK